MVCKFIRYKVDVMSLLTDKQKEEIQKLTDEVLKEAELVVKDYEDNPSDISGSMVIIHQNSPYLKEK